MSNTIENLIAERKNLRQSIIALRFVLKSALFKSDLLQAQTAQRNILKAELRIRQINFEITTQAYTEEINAFEHIIDEQTKI